MWPMLAGLGPLLGEGASGGSVGADGARSLWIYRDGAAIHRDSGGTEHPYAQVEPPRPTLTPAPPVAVLHDRGTASSGEALAVAFRGRPGTRSFGERTWGASTATRGVRLPDGANMVVAVEVFVDRAGARYPDGVEPAETLPAADAMLPLQEDPAVARAASWLAGRSACTDPASLDGIPRRSGTTKRVVDEAPRAESLEALALRSAGRRPRRGRRTSQSFRI